MNDPGLICNSAGTLFSSIDAEHIMQDLIHRHFVIFQDSGKEIIESAPSSPLNTKLKVCLFYLVFKIEVAFH